MNFKFQKVQFIFYVNINLYHLYLLVCDSDVTQIIFTIEKFNK